MAKVRAQYPNSTEADLHLCISHRRRRAINSMRQARFTGQHGVEIPEHDGEPSYWAAAGTPNALLEISPGDLQHLTHGTWMDITERIS